MPHESTVDHESAYHETEESPMATRELEHEISEVHKKTAALNIIQPPSTITHTHDEDDESDD